jgi:hypothetical protein
MADSEGREARGLRRSRFLTLSDEDIDFLKQEIQAIGADLSVFMFNAGDQTSYMDDYDVIFIKGDVFPDLNSIHPRDRMSSKAVLAHEYYGHRTYRWPKAAKSSWNDEFRASYTAAKIAPGLSDVDRRELIEDAIERAREAGITIRYNNFMRRILYGIDS